MSHSLLFNILAQGCLLTLISVSFSICYRTLSFFNLCHAATIVIGGYSVHISLQWLDSLWIALFIGCAVSSIYLISVSLLLMGMKKYQGENWQLMVASLGLYMATESFLSIVMGDQAISIPPNRLFEVMSSFYMGTQPLIVISVCVIVFMYIVFMRFTSLGVILEAAASNVGLAESFGINRVYVRCSGLILSATLGALAGFLIYQDSSLQPYSGFSWLILASIVVIFSGNGKVRSLVVAAFFLAFLQATTAMYLGSKWTNIASFTLLIALLVIRPYGLSNIPPEKVRV